MLSSLCTSVRHTIVIYRIRRPFPQRGITKSSMEHHLSLQARRSHRLAEVMMDVLRASGCTREQREVQRLLKRLTHLIGAIHRPVGPRMDRARRRECNS